MKIQPINTANVRSTNNTAQIPDEKKVAATTVSLAAAAGTGVYLAKSGKAAKAFSTVKDAAIKGLKAAGEKAKPVIEKVKNSGFSEKVKGLVSKAKEVITGPVKNFVKDKWETVTEFVKAPGKFFPKLASKKSKMAETFNNFVK